MVEYIAHITDLNGERKIQTVSEHCRKTAEYSSRSLELIGLKNTAYLAGLLHDMGKCKREYLEYIIKANNGENPKKGSANHTFAAVIFLIEKYHDNKSDIYAMLTCEIIAFAIASHHGLMDCVNPDFENGFIHRYEKNRKEIFYAESRDNYLEQCASLDEVDNLFRLACDEVKSLFDSMKNYIGKCDMIELDYKNKTLSFFMGMVARLVLSALIDGDRRDTAEFMQGSTNEFIKTNKQFWHDRVNFFEEKYQHDILEKFDYSLINRSRRYISKSAKAFANCSDGIYRMTVQTGAGKTLSSLRFALSCAEIHLKRRIILVIPLLSILEQNADVIKNFIDRDDIVLEHHSNVVREETAVDNEHVDNYELLAESWDSSIVITTLVQLLNTLFSGKTTAVRRMRSLCNSIIVIDEVQSVPRKLTYMFNLALDYLAKYCGCTIVLSSATQPCFENMDYPIIFSEHADMIKETEEMKSAFKRTEIINKTDSYITLDELADFSREIIAENSSLLVICNKKSTALELYNQLKIMHDDKIKLYHLSTNMCMQHRRAVLKNINNDLAAKDGRKVICVSTQLVEAGVDFSFESCIRIKAGLDNIAQAAGRCNRNGEFDKECKVYVVSLKDEKLNNLPDILASQTAYNDFIGIYDKNKSKYGDMLSTESVKCFYNRLISSSDVKKQFTYPITIKSINTSMLNMLSDNHEFFSGYNGKQQDKDRITLLNQAFKTAGNEFCVFENNTTDVLVRYNDEADEIIDELFSFKAKKDLKYFKSLIKRAKPYTISLFEYELNDLDKKGMIYSDENGRFLVLNEQCYDKNTGLNLNEATIL
ncbi:MAG: CRISPR-associated helicase Cas3' [Ruminococcus sp.]|nr:CRISPR-associated helicase Cas3' [Ruminococcus sp.]